LVYSAFGRLKDLEKTAIRHPGLTETGQATMVAIQAVMAALIAATAAAGIKMGCPISFLGCLL